MGCLIASMNANYNSGNDANQTRDVGLYAANPWGFFDMHGNVWEWTADWYNATYPTGEVVMDPTGSASGQFGKHGGFSWERTVGRTYDQKAHGQPTLM